MSMKCLTRWIHRKLNTNYLAKSMLMNRDNSSALLVVTMAITMLNTAATDAERAVLFSLLAQASTEIPEVVAMM